MLKFWPLSANGLQLSRQFPTCCLKLHRPLPLYIKASPLCERHFWMHPMCAETSKGFRALCTGLHAVTNLGLWDRLLFEHTETRHKRAKSVTLHMAASKAASSSSSSYFLPSSLSVLLSSTFNVWHFDTEHPISRVLVGWLYMQMGW